MRINELTPYRKNPVYQSLQRRMPARSKLNADSLSSPSIKLSRFADWVDSQGYHVVEKGQGGRALVYKRPGDRYVIKVFNQDPGYLEYLDYVLANQSNPHVPKIRGRYMKINDDTYAVRMEELTDMDNDYRSEDRRILQMIEGADFRHAAQNAYLQEHLPQLAQLMRDLDKMGLENDIYYGNVMKRGDTLVITDPVR